MNTDSKQRLICGDVLLHCDRIREALFARRKDLVVAYEEKALRAELRLDRHPIMTIERCDRERAKSLAEMLGLFPAHLEPYTVNWQGERPHVLIYARESNENARELMALMDAKGYKFEFWKRTHDYDCEIRFGMTERGQYSPTRIMEHLDAFAAAYPGFLEHDFTKDPQRD